MAVFTNRALFLTTPRLDFGFAEVVDIRHSLEPQDLSDCRAPLVIVPVSGGEENGLALGVPYINRVAVMRLFGMPQLRFFRLIGSPRIPELIGELFPILQFGSGPYGKGQHVRSRCHPVRTNFMVSIVHARSLARGAAYDCRAAQPRAPESGVNLPFTLRRWRPIFPTAAFGRSRTAKRLARPPSKGRSSGASGPSFRSWSTRLTQTALSHTGSERLESSGPVHQPHPGDVGAPYHDNARPEFGHLVQTCDNAPQR